MLGHGHGHLRAVLLNRAGHLDVGGHDVVSPFGEGDGHIPNVLQLHLGHIGVPLLGEGLVAEHIHIDLCHSGHAGVAVFAVVQGHGLNHRGEGLPDGGVLFQLGQLGHIQRAEELGLISGEIHRVPGVAAAAGELGGRGQVEHVGLQVHAHLALQVRQGGQHLLQKHLFQRG